MKIVTIDSALQDVLKKKTQDFLETEFTLAKEISEKLFLALKPYFPAAGLAAPQIGISKSIFIFSFDRHPENLETVVNPFFVPLENTLIEGWEGCLSVILSDGIWKLAKVPRYEKIQVTYFNLEGEKIEKKIRRICSQSFPA